MSTFQTPFSYLNFIEVCFRGRPTAVGAPPPPQWVEQRSFGSCTRMAPDNANIVAGGDEPSTFIHISVCIARSRAAARHTINCANYEG
jgi:hypothetical protein